MGDDWLAAYRGTEVVIDTDAGHTMIGVLVDVGPDHLELEAADLHDHLHANSSKDAYLLEASTYGVTVNRRRIAVPRHRLLAVSRLEDIGS